MTILYVADYEYGRPSLARVEASKATDKTFTPESTETLLGWMYIGKHPRFSSYGIVTFSLADALNWLWTQNEGAITQAEKNLAKLREQARELTTAIRKTESEAQP